MRSTGMLQGFAVKYSARVTPMEGADLLFKLVPTRTLQQPVVRPYQPLPRVPTRGVFIGSYGKGQAIFAALPLYQYWLPGTQLFQEFHADLFARGAELAFDVPVDFLPARAAQARFADGSVALWAKDTLSMVTRLRNTDRLLYALPGGWCALRPEETMLHTGPGHYNLAEALPIAVDPTDATVYAAAAQADAGGVVVDLWTDEAAAGAKASLHFFDGRYRITPGSSHRITLFRDGIATVQDVTADEMGEIHLALPLTARHTTVALSGAITVLIPDEDAEDASAPTELLIEAIPATMEQYPAPEVENHAAP